LKLSAGVLLGVSLLLIGHTVYLSNYIKTHQAEFARADQLQSELQAAETEIAGLIKKNSEIETVNASKIAALNPRR
jgi:hypothetical protein